MQNQTSNEIVKTECNN